MNSNFFVVVCFRIRQLANELEYTEYKAFGKTPAQLQEFLAKVKTVLSSARGKQATDVLDDTTEMMHGFRTGFKAYYDDERKESAVERMKMMHREEFADEMNFLEQGDVYLDQGILL